MSCVSFDFRFRIGLRRSNIGPSECHILCVSDSTLQDAQTLALMTGEQGNVTNSKHSSGQGFEMSGSWVWNNTIKTYVTNSNIPKCLSMRDLPGHV